MSLVVDTSAAVAILMAKPERDQFRDLLLRSTPVCTFPELFSVEVVTLDLVQARLAEEGNRRFGKGRSRPPDVLNFGDLFA